MDSRQSSAPTISLDLALIHIVQYAQELVPFDSGGIALLDRNRNVLAPYFYQRIGSGGSLPPPLRLGEGIVGSVAQSGQSVIVNDIHDDPRYVPDGSDTMSQIAVPIWRGTKLLGVFSVESAKPRSYTKKHLKIVEMLAEQAALTLDNFTLQEAQGNPLAAPGLLEIAAITTSNLEVDEMLSETLREAAHLLDAEGALLMLPDAASTALTPHQASRYGLALTLPFGSLALDGDSHMVHVYHTGQPYISNVPGEPVIECHSILTFPLNIRNRTLGVLSLVNRKHGHFESVHLTLAHAVSAQIAMCIENVQLFAGERTRADLMALINAISQELTATLDLPGLMRKVVQTIHDLLGYKTVTIMLLDETGQNLIVQASVSSIPGGATPTGFTFPITQGVSGRAVRSGETQTVADIREDGDFFTPGNVGLGGSVLMVPLRARTRILGTIEAFSEQVNGFLKTDHFVLETLAAQVSIAIENARLWNQAQRRLLEQGIVHQIGQDLASILDYNELATAVVQHMTRALDTAVCVLTSYNSEMGAHTVEAEYRIGEFTRHSDQYTLPPFLGQTLGANERSLLNGAVLTRRQVIAYRDGPGTTGRQQKQMKKLGIFSEMILAMIVGDRVIGCMMWVEARRPREFTPSDVRLAQTLTSQAAIAIENARMYRQAQRQAGEQTLLRRIAVGFTVVPDMESLLRQLAWEAAHAVEADCAIVSLRAENGTFPISANFPLTLNPSASVLGRAGGNTLPAITHTLEEGLTVSFYTKGADDSATSQEISALFGKQPISLLLTPIVRRGETIGLIEISCQLPARIFDKHEIQLLEAISNQGALTIDNVSLSEREQHRVHQLEKLQASSRSIIGQLQTEALLKTIVREAATIFEVDAVSLLMRDPQQDYFTPRAALGLSERYLLGRRVHNSDYNETNLRPQYWMAEHTLSAEQEHVFRAEGIKSVLFVPIVKAGQNLGILDLYTKSSPHPFTDEERELAQLFASQAAIAIENARLFQALEDRAVELTKVNRLKSEFLASVSHELRTPMNSINGYSEMLMRSLYGALNDKQSDRVERILRNGRTLLALIDDLLDIAKIDAGRMELQIEPINVRDELSTAIYNLESEAAKRGLYLKLDVPDNLPPVNADLVRFKQVVTNLIGNGVKFTKQGGVIVQASISDTYGVAFIAFSVIDTGIGIRPEDQEIIFDEFRQADGSATREYGGTGLGLAISKKLVEMMQGHIWVESQPARGSTFTFTLPVAGEIAQV
ncbi:MAG: GAF domain-containing protein [Chloroflexota bacterium]